MIGKTMLGLFLAIGLFTIPAFAEIDTPYKQFNEGIPLEQIQCRDSKILMETSRGTPACVNENSVEKLEKKLGFTIVNPLQIQHEETIKPLRRPFETPVLQQNFVNPHEIMTNTLDDLQTAKQVAKQSTRQSTSDEFIVTDWIPEYIPKGYKLGYSLHGWDTFGNDTKHGLTMHFVPVLFVYTNSTTDNDVREAGIIYSVNPKLSAIFDSYENMFSYQKSFSRSDDLISEIIVNQTNGYFGTKKPDNEYAGFNTRLAFDDYYVSFGFKGDLSYDDGIKIANSIQGVIIPE